MWAFEERLECRRTDLLFALDQHPNVAGQRAAGLEPRRDRVRVRDAARLVVGAAASVEATAALGRLERVALPVLDDAGRLHVVVCIEKDSRRIVARVHPLADHVGMRTIDVREPHRLEAVRAQEIGGRFGARLHVGLARSGSALMLGMRTSVLELGARRDLAPRRLRRRHR